MAEEPRPGFPWWILTVIALALMMVSMLVSQYAVRMSLDASRRGMEIQQQMRRR
jgi:hypothetical protein